MTFNIDPGMLQWLPLILRCKSLRPSTFALYGRNNTTRILIRRQYLIWRYLVI